MTQTDCRHYVTYSGVRLPLKLVNQLSETDIANRNTFFRAWFDEHGRLIQVQKMVYGEVELQHRYEYHDDGRLKLAEITEADETRVMRFDAQGRASVDPSMTCEEGLELMGPVRDPGENRPV